MLRWIYCLNKALFENNYIKFEELDKLEVKQPNLLTVTIFIETLAVLIKLFHYMKENSVIYDPERALYIIHQKDTKPSVVNRSALLPAKINESMPLMRSWINGRYKRNFGFYLVVVVPIVPQFTYLKLMIIVTMTYLQKCGKDVFRSMENYQSIIQKKRVSSSAKSVVSE